MSEPHHRDCDYWFEQYPNECTCGATRPKAVWFDTYVQECEAARELSIREHATREKD